ncbi:MAG: cupin domain-containing protein [Actinomycetota bacterium]
MVASLGLRASSLRMVLRGENLDLSTYTVTPRMSTRTTEAQVSPALVYRRFSEGATIVLESLHKFWQPLTDFCRELELALGHRLQVNAYVTPPGSQGFSTHRDDHDVFILQISGVKHWVVYDEQDEKRVLVDHVLRPGACLYIPKGFPHEASTAEQASAHLTVGVLTHRSIEILEVLTKLAAAEPAFQERIPRRATGDIERLSEWIGRYLEEVRLWLDKVDIDELTERMARRMMTSAQPILRGQLQQFELLREIGDETSLIRRRGAICALFPTSQGLKVLLVDRELKMPLIARPAMEEIARRQQLQVKDLYPLLDRDGALVLVRRLIREGLLEVAIGG